MERATGKAERLLQIETLLLAYPEGLTQAEIARRTGVNRSTINRYLPDLTSRFSIHEDDEGRLFIDRDHYLMNVKLTLHEAMSVHLAARLMATRMDKQNPHAAAALRKLGLALEKLAPRIAEHLKASAEVMEDQAQRHDPVYLDVLETLTRAWSDGRVARLWHRMEDGRVFAYRFAPYFIEPYAVGQTTHAIGWRKPPEAVRTLKLERIQRVELTDELYTIPEDFELRALLADAWGIWYSETEPVEVALRFHPRVVSRVRETQWHRSEEVEEQEDGSLVWRARVAEVREMVPWIRGWGADVEVLEPEELKEQMIAESRRMATLYGIAEARPPPLYQLLWAKTDRKTEQTHPLICHMIDVGQVAWTLWSEALTESIRSQLADALGLDVDAAGRTIAFWASLHDLGKASPCFQRKHHPAQEALEQAGIAFPKLFVKEPCPHGTISAAALGSMLEAQNGLPRRLAQRVARALGGHHGEWPAPDEVQGLRSSQKGDSGWTALQDDLLQVLVDLYKAPVVERLGHTTEEENALVTLLSGLVSAADWLGSMERFFPYATLPVDPVRYSERATKQARQALHKLGWIGWSPPTQAKSFTELFTLSPRPAQDAVIELAQHLHQPSLVIIEAPTGTGKTESALYLADHWARTCKQRGLYVAMPTMATSNQMFARVQEVLARRYPHSLVNTHLIHSQARWRKDMQDIRLETLDERPEGTVAAMAWFLPHKRSLLAPFGVGTVDQALLSVLQARHFFVRLFGLSHKTVIFDEVHAYDTYMSTIFQRLLSWLRAVGSSVIILSATLPARTRRELVQAYVGHRATLPGQGTYPAITWATGDRSGVVPLAPPASRSIGITWIAREPQAILSLLADQLREGGCAAVICNTVRRAQDVYRALREAAIVPEQDLTLFHARFPFAWRDEIEQRVLSRFGKQGDRPRKAIVVATQVIEQSLDLDFDLMVTDMAPIDLIVQRAGRLHRHDRPTRPPALALPRLTIAMPADAEDVPDFGEDAWVYEPYVLLCSWLALKERSGITLPQDTEALIEAVYGEQNAGLADLASPALIAALERAQAAMDRNQQKEQHEAHRRLIAPPSNPRLMNTSEALLEEDEPAYHASLQALTRLIPPSVSLVCLHRTGSGLTLEPDGSGPQIDLAEHPASDITEQLARHTVNVSNWPVVRYFLDRPVPDGWRDHPLLRNHRAVVFTDGASALEGAPYTLRLSRTCGLEIIKEEA